MNAIILSHYGPPQALQIKEVPKPNPGDNQVLVKVHATAVNDVDWSFVRGKPYLYRLIYGLAKPKVAVLGGEVAGTVVEAGAGVTRFRIGDQVYGDTSMAGFGGFAEYACVDENALAHKPAAMRFEEAAALPHAAMLAYQGLVDVGQIRQGERVLINGAGGGVGIIGVQIAKRYGAEVTGVDSAIKLDALKSVGFDHVIDYWREDFTRNGQRYDLILDAKSTRAPSRYLRALNPGGRYVTVGGDWPRLLQIACMGPLLGKFSGKSLRIVSLKPNRDLDYMNRMFEEHGIVTVIDGPYTLAEVPMAIQRFGEAKHIGKVVIKVA